MPVQATDIDQEIAYILTYWVQNNNQLITGTIGQNVVWNLAQFIKQNPENYQKATVVPSSSNYTTNKNQCVLIFTNNSSGGLDWVDNRWNKYYFINTTNNIRNFFSGKFYYDINGIPQTNLAAKSELYIAKGDDDFWYQVNAPTPVGSSVLIGIAGRGRPYDPIVGSSVYQSPIIVGLGLSHDGFIDLVYNKGIYNNYEAVPDFDYDSSAGLINFNDIVFSALDTLKIPLNQ